MDFDSGCNDLNQKITEWLEWDKVFLYFIINYSYVNKLLINVYPF